MRGVTTSIQEVTKFDVETVLESHSQRPLSDKKRRVAQVLGRLERNFLIIK